jgi:hypothetical protein
VIPIAVFGAIALVVWRTFLHTRRRRTYAGVVICLVIVGWLYVWWNAYLASYRQSSTSGWTADWSNYAPLSDGWAFVRTQVPPDQKLAYANTYFVYPLYGFDLDRRVVYVPLRSKLRQISDLPSQPGKLRGDQIEPAIVRATIANPDRDAWIKALRESGASILFIGKRSLSGSVSDASPPELTFAEHDPAHFQTLFINPEAAIYRFNP